MPRVAGTNNIYYLDRLYADWEKVLWKKQDFDYECHNGNVIETYSGTDSQGVTLQFYRFIQGEYIYYFHKYSSDDETAGYRVLDTKYDIRLGGRYEDIDAIKAIVRIDAEGVDGRCTRYVMVDAAYSGYIQEEDLGKLDDEDDLHNENLNAVSDRREDGLLSVSTYEISSKTKLATDRDDGLLSARAKYCLAADTARADMIAAAGTAVTEYNDMVKRGEDPIGPRATIEAARRAMDA